MALRLPPGFVARMQGQLGSEYAAFEAALEAPPPTSIRLNPAKPVAAMLVLKEAKPIPWCTGAYWLPTRPSFILDPLWHAGAYYVQEASSMLIAQAVDSSSPLVLDLCAAPGGKTTLLAGLLPAQSFILANEAIRTRVPMLVDNLIRWGSPNLYACSYDPEAFAPLKAFFNTVLVDAPCSGEGLWRRQPTAAAGWSENLVALAAARQRRILAAAAPLVQLGGRLIYSTCTYAPAENGDNVAWLLAQFPGQWEVLPLPAVQAAGALAVHSVGGSLLGYQVYPHLLQGEGFFVAALTRVQSDAAPPTRELKPSYKQATPTGRPPAALAPLISWLKAGEWQLLQLEEHWYALPEQHLAILQQLRNYLQLRLAGLQLGSLKGKDVLPHPALAVSSALAPSAPRWELSHAEALHYLKREPLAANAPQQGWQVASYNGLGMGWGKDVPGRFNNYLPASWRIRKDLPGPVED